MSRLSDAEAALEWQMKVADIPTWAAEFTFAQPRRWRFDFAWPREHLAVEVEGGVWIRGHHSSGAGFAADCEKYNEAALLGWRVLRVTPEMVLDGRALAWIERALA